MFYVDLRSMAEEEIQARMLWMKAERVVLSCTTLEQLEAARQYVRLVLRRIKAGCSFGHLVLIPGASLEELTKSKLNQINLNSNRKPELLN